MTIVTQPGRGVRKGRIVMSSRHSGHSNVNDRFGPRTFVRRPQCLSDTRPSHRLPTA